MCDDPVTKFIPQLNKWMVVAEKDEAHVLLKPLARPVTNHKGRQGNGRPGFNSWYHASSQRLLPRGRQRPATVFRRKNDPMNQKTRFRP
jgi:hypothetical protein